MIGESPTRPGYFQAQPEVLTPLAMSPAVAGDDVDGAVSVVRALRIPAQSPGELSHRAIGVSRSRLR